VTCLFHVPEKMRPCFVSLATAWILTGMVSGSAVNQPHMPLHVFDYLAAYIARFAFTVSLINVFLKGPLGTKGLAANPTNQGPLCVHALVVFLQVVLSVANFSTLVTDM